MANYFQVEVVPDLVDGDISYLIADDKTDTPFASRDILFKWTEVDIPSGTNLLRSVQAHVMGEDGGTASIGYWHLLFAKSIDGDAPDALGSTNSAATTAYDLPRKIVGAVTLGSTTVPYGMLNGIAYGTYFTPGGQLGSDANENNTLGGNIDLPIVLDLEPGSGTNVGYDKLYVAALTSTAFDFSTGIESTGAIVAEATATIAVDGVDPRKCFQIGDSVYVHDLDTAAGTVKSMTSGTIVLNAVTAVAVANNDEIMNGNPIRVKLGFEG